ncbi:MAG: SpoIIE family protein phosphatase [Planctomycetes bacterium]|nr:SpoIIE family protein phosphatase [Planctomycetota bacterium]
MSRGDNHALDVAAMLGVLDVSRRLAGPFELTELLTQIIDAGREILAAERGSVFLYDPATRELFSKVATGAQEIRFSIDRGIAGQCARDRATIAVPDCYKDPRFNPEVDRKTGFRTRSLITVPLIGLDDELVGVMQLLNPARDCAASADQRIAEALAGQAAVAIQRVRLLDERMVKLKLERDLALAKQIQMAVLPKSLPVIKGYDLATYGKPADETGGDIYDLIHLHGSAEKTPGLLLLLADATGHGIGPALSVTQVRAMLRIGVRLGAGINAAAKHINEQLTEDLESGRFVTAFLGRLDLTTHSLEYHAAGQGPILHFRAAAGLCDFHPATTLPLGIMSDPPMDEAAILRLAPGDIVALLTDGIYEYQNPGGEEMGTQRVNDVVYAHRDGSAQQVLDAVLAALQLHADGAPQRDDVTAVVVKRTV